MKAILLAGACLCLSGCLGASAGVRTAVDLATPYMDNAAAAFEVKVRDRCPRTPVETALFDSARLGFDLSVGPKLTQPERDALNAVRAETDRICGL